MAIWPKEMKKLILRIVWVMAAVLLLNECTRRVLTEYSWGDRRFHSKRLYLNSQATYPEVCFMGSSRVNRQIDPAIFDSVLAKPKGFSFNLASDGLFPPKSYFLLRRLIEKDGARPKVVFMELAEIDTVFIWSLHTREHTYAYRATEFPSLVEAHLHASQPGPGKRGALHRHMTGLLHYMGNLGQLPDMLGFAWEEWLGQGVDSLFLGPAKNGFRSLDLELVQPDAPHHGDFVNRNLEFLNDTLALNRRSETTAPLFREAAKLPPVNEAHLRMARELISLAESHGIHLVFFVPPRAGRFTYESVLPIARQLPADHIILLGDAARYPEFYQARYSYDVPHVNQAGARRVTAALAREFARLTSLPD